MSEVREFRPLQAQEIDGRFHIANHRDIIASKRATGRKKDLIELPLLESFRLEFEKRGSSRLRSASDAAASRFQKKQ